MTEMLHTKFFDRPADIVAKELIGCRLCISGDMGTVRQIITETEAYMGPHDLACHASKGRTKRTEVLYKPAGTIYIYLIYGMYDMLNIVTGAKGYPAAVLIRGTGEWNGPGRLTKALGITRQLNGAALGRRAGLWIERREEEKIKITKTPRIGIAYAKEWAEKELRFVLDAPIA